MGGVICSTRKTDFHLCLLQNRLKPGEEGAARKSGSPLTNESMSKSMSASRRLTESPQKVGCAGGAGRGGEGRAAGSWVLLLTGCMPGTKNAWQKSANVGHQCFC